MKSKRDRRLIVIMIMVICLLVSLVLFSGNGVKTGLLPSMTPDEMHILSQEVDNSQFGFLLNSKPAFITSDSPGNLRIQNLPANHYNMQVQMRLDNSENIIYNSPIIKPNQYIEYDKVDLAVGNGMRKADVRIEVLDGTKLVGIINTKVELYIGYGG